MQFLDLFDAADPCDAYRRTTSVRPQQALAMARRQRAKAWELRAAMSLARLRQQRGDRAGAREVLGPVYHWFAEGFDTADLVEASVMLAELNA